MSLSYCELSLSAVVRIAAFHKILQCLIVWKLLMSLDKYCCKECVKSLMLLSAGALSTCACRGTGMEGSLQRGPQEGA